MELFEDEMKSCDDFFLELIVLGSRMIIFVEFLRQKQCQVQEAKEEKVHILFPRSVFL